MKAKKFTFKNEYSDTTIKFNKQNIGTICASNWQSKDNKWCILLHLEKSETITDNNPNCSWKNVILKAKFDDVDSAKVWLNDNINLLTEKYIFHGLKD